jgi:hypothetical protein
MDTRRATKGPDDSVEEPKEAQSYQSPALQPKTSDNTWHTEFTATVAITLAIIGRRCYYAQGDSSS